jgi:hypothetical protein
LPCNSVEDVKRQEELLAEANEKIARLRCAADLLVSAEFWGENAKDKLQKVQYASLKAVELFEKGDLAEFQALAAKERRGQSMFHWCLEFPEVIVKRGGFDAFVGNPPFMGGQKITSSIGDKYRPFLLSVIADNRKGSADLCVYFLIREVELLRNSALIGMVATSAIAEGDSREVGLEHLLTKGVVITNSRTRSQWSGTASVTFAMLSLHKGGWQGETLLNDEKVDGINAYLVQSNTLEGKPFRLRSNMNDSFQGSNALGLGFVLTPTEAQSLVASDPNNTRVIFPYLDGQDLNSAFDHTPTRWIIYFFDWPLNRQSAPIGYEGPVASDFKQCLSIVEEKVKPERASNNDKRRREIWWQFTRPTTKLYHRVKERKWVLAIATQATKYVAFGKIVNPTIFSNALAVITLDSHCAFAVLSSSFHELWARQFASYNLDLLRYSPTDLFETFPFPYGVIEKGDAVYDSLGGFGECYLCQRVAIMTMRREGLTDIYNRFHNPDESSFDIQKLRDLHDEMDNAVAAAYGWSDLNLDHGFHETKQGIRFTISEPARREVLQRLLKLNHERYAEEVKQGLHDKKKGATKRAAPEKKVTKEKEDKPQKPTTQFFDFGDEDA